MIIAIASQNGGAEKSILAANLAASRALFGRRVLLVDSDPLQTSCRWSQRRGQAHIRPAVVACSMAGQGLHAALERLAGNHEDVIIDTERRDTLSSRSALIMAEIAVLPIQPQLLDAENSETLVRRIETARLFNPRLRVLLVPAGIPCDMSIGALAEMHALAERIPAASLSASLVQDSRALRLAFREGRSVVEYGQGDTDAATEMIAVCHEAFSEEHKSLRDRPGQVLMTASTAGIPQPSR